MKKKKILVLGASRLEAEIVECAQDMGFYAIVTDYNKLEDSPAKAVADESWDISWSDINALTNKCKEANINGVIAGFSDRRAYCAAKLSKALGLTYYADGAKLDQIYDKRNFSTICEQSGFDVPKRFAPDDLITFPVIVKPNDNGGSKGISICYSEKDLDNAIIKARENSQTGSYVIEEFIEDADEFCIWHLVVDGRVHFVATSDMYLATKEIGNEKVKIPLGIKFPSKHEDYLRNEYEAIFSNLIKNCGISNGLLGVQCLFKDGRVFPYDPTYRLDNSEIHQISEYYGSGNSLKMLINYSINGSMKYRDDLTFSINFKGDEAVFRLIISINPGIISAVEGVDDLRNLDGFISLYKSHTIGDSSDGKYLLGGALCLITFRAISQSDLKKKLDHIYNSVHVLDENGNEMVVRLNVQQLVLGDANRAFEIY